MTDDTAIAPRGPGRDPALQRELLLRDRPRLVALALLTLLRAAGLLLVAEGLARGITGAVAGRLDLDAPLALLAGGLIARLVAEWATRVVAARTGVAIKAELRGGLLGALLRPGVDTPRVALLAGRRLDELDRYFLDVVPATLGVAIVPAAVLLRVLGADWLSTLILVLTLPLVPVFLILVGLHTRDEVGRAASALDRLAAHLVELACGLPVIVGLGRLDEQRTALAAIGDQHRRSTVRTLRTAFLSALVLELIATISVAVVAVVIGIRLIHGSLPLETGLLVLVLAPECFAPFRVLGAAFHAAEDGLDAVRRARALIAGSAASAGAHVTRTAPDVRADAQHSGPGLVAVTAPSGGGKSTLLALLADRLAPEAVVDGSVVAPARAAIAAQHPRTTEGSLRDELLLWADGAEAATERMAARLGLAELLDRDPATLSPGELRRLAIGRAALRLDAHGGIGLLDEPTSQLDPERADAVRRLLAELSRRHPVVVATHDADLVAIATTRWALDASAELEGSSSARARATEIASAPPPDRSAPSAVSAEEASDLSASAIDRTAARTGAGAPAPARSRRRDLRAALRLLAPELPRLVAAALLGAAATASAAALTGVSGWLIVRAGEHVAIMYLLVAIVGVRFFGIARAVLRYLDRLLAHDAALRGAQRLRTRLWSSLAALGPGYRRATRPGETLDVLVGVADTVRDLVPRVVTPVLGAALALAAWVTASAIILPASLPVTVVAALVVLVGAPATTLLVDRTATRRAEAERSALLRRAATVGAAADELVSSGLAAGARRALQDSAGRLARAEQRATLAAGSGSAVVLAALGAATLALLDLAARAVADGRLDGPFVAVLVLLPLALAESGEAAVDAARRAPALGDAVRRILGVIATSDGVSDAARPAALDADRAERAVSAGSAGYAGEPSAIGALELDDVTLRWPGGAPVIERLDAVVTREQWLVVDGPSGSGKSTLLSAILGQLAPAHGRVRLPATPSASLAGGAEDAEAAAGLPADVPRVAWAPQDAHVFDASLRANLRLGRPADDAPDDAELLDALARVGLAELARERDGLDTPIGAGGAALSGGERQRLAVARALLSRADVVLIDEPTAHLDQATGDALLRELRTALESRIVVLVSHDPRAAEPGDLRLRLGGGIAHPLLVL